MMTLTRVPKVLLTVAAVVALYLLFIVAHLMGVAHAAADAPPAPAAIGQVTITVTTLIALLGATLALGVALTAAVAKFLHFIAPLTKTTLDDDAAAKLDKVHDFLVTLVARVPGPVDPGVAARNPQSGRVGAGLLATLALGSVLAGAVVGFAAVGCATLKDAPAVAESAIVDCVKADQQPITALVVQLAADALTYVLGGGVVDWSALESAAWAQGKVTGGCALAEFVHGVSGKAGASVAHVSQVDPARAALEHLRVRAGGVQWRTAAGVL